MGKRRGQPKPTPKRTGPTMAEKADRHILYEQAVQSVEDEIEFLGETFRALRSREPILLREDFCGTANAGLGPVCSATRCKALAPIPE